MDASLLLNAMPSFSVAMQREGWKRQQIVIAKYHDYAAVMIFAKHVDGRYCWWSTSTLAYGAQPDYALDFMDIVSREEARDNYKGVVQCVKAGEVVNGRLLPIDYQIWELKEDGLWRADNQEEESA